MSQPILVVEVDQRSRASLVALLEAHGFAVLTAAEGLEALYVLRHGPRPALILLDMALPVCDGWQFLAEKRQSAAWDDIPVVIMTGLGVASDE